MSNTSMSAKCLNSTPLPSMTGLPASAPTLPSPSTARAVGDDRDQVALGRVAVGILRVGGDASHRLGHPRRIGQRQVALRAGRLGDLDADLSRARLLVIVQRRLVDLMVGMLLVEICVLFGIGHGALLVGVMRVIGT
jgi:hypothetical protein